MALVSKIKEKAVKQSQKDNTLETKRPKLKQGHTTLNSAIHQEHIYLKASVKIDVLNL